MWNTRITPSFPSGHTTASVTFATVIGLHYPQHRFTSSTFALLSAYSQIYTGNHYVGDILAGLALGYLGGQFIYNLTD